MVEENVVRTSGGHCVGKILPGTGSVDLVITLPSTISRGNEFLIILST